MTDHYFHIPIDWSLVTVMSADASTRRYARIEKSGQTAIFMDCRNEHSDRPGMNEFIAIADWLRDHGIYTPEIYEISTDEKYLIIEDFGDLSFRRAIDNDHISINDVYHLAADVLSHMRQIKNLPTLPDYFDSFIHDKHADIMRIYYPAVIDGAHDLTVLEHTYQTIWHGIESQLPPCPRGFVHGDYHLENMMYLPGHKGLARLGLIDFQDAMIGPAPYDLANLLLDARRDVPQDLQNALLSGFSESFLLWYRVLALQFHLRVIALFKGIHLNQNRDTYVQHIPRLEHYIRAALHQDIFKPLKQFFDSTGLFFMK